jgi:hypothetical protein
MTDNSVLVKGDPLTKDAQSRVQTSPGELAGFDASGELEPGGTDQPRFVKESPPKYAFDTNLPAGNVEFYLCRQGDEVRALVTQATGAQVTYDPYVPLYDNGDGNLTPEGSGVVVAYLASESSVDIGDGEVVRHTVEVA